MTARGFMLLPCRIPSILSPSSGKRKLFEMKGNYEPQKKKVFTILALLCRADDKALTSWAWLESGLAKYLPLSSSDLPPRNHLKGLDQNPVCRVWVMFSFLTQLVGPQVCLICGKS